MSNLTIRKNIYASLLVFVAAFAFSAPAPAEGFFDGGPACIGWCGGGLPIVLACGISLSADRTSISPGESVQLSWQSVLAISERIINLGPVTPDVTVAGVKNGVDTATPSQTTTYTAECTYGGQGIFGYVTGTVYSDPITITVTNPNAAPNTPTITGPTTGVTNTNYQFSISGTDSNGDQVRYNADWDNNGSVDDTTLYRDSGWVWQPSRSWSTAGTYTFRAHTQDVPGATSGWRSHTITISNPSTQCSDGIDNDGDGRIDLADYGCSSGTDTTESPNPQCSDGIDNNGNGLIDTADVGACTGPTDGNEQPLPTSNLSLTGAALVRPSGTVTLSWSAANVRAGTCTLVGTNGDSWNLTGTSGTRTSSALTAEAVFTLACTDLNGQPQSTSVTVRVAPSFEEI